MNKYEINEFRIGNFVRLNNPRYRPDQTGNIFRIRKLEQSDASFDNLVGLYRPGGMEFSQFMEYVESVVITPEIRSLSMANGATLTLRDELHEMQNLYFVLFGTELEFNNEIYNL